MPKRAGAGAARVWTRGLGLQGLDRMMGPGCEWFWQMCVCFNAARTDDEASSFGRSPWGQAVISVADGLPQYDTRGQFAISCGGALAGACGRHLPVHLCDSVGSACGSHT